MVEILRMSKPIEKGGVILPADFRQYFGYGWDMLYGTFVLTALCLVTWLKLDSNFYLLLIVTYVDVFVVFDTVLSIYICSYQLVQIMYVNRVIEVCCIALQRLFHLTTQLFIFLASAEISCGSDIIQSIMYLPNSKLAYARKKIFRQQ